jgi:hypothetical protein
MDHDVVTAAANATWHRNAELVPNGFEQSYPIHGGGASVRHNAIRHGPLVDIDPRRELKPCRPQLQ